MNLIGRVTKKLERLNGRLLDVILRFGVPRYGKKLMLLVSIFSGVRHQEPLTSVELERLNATLGLASCTEALEFPAIVSKRIWKQCDLQQEDLSKPQQLLAKIPQWLRYDNDEKMVDDIRKVVNHSLLQVA